MRGMSSVLIMAKAPRAGDVNTRLEPLLEPEGCAALQRELIRHTARWAAMVAARVWLAYAPAGAGAELAQLVPGSVRLFAQADGDLGRRLRHAVALVGREHSGVPGDRRHRRAAARPTARACRVAGTDRRA